MSRQIKPDPYCGFKDDRERRLALNVRARSQAVASVAAALVMSSGWIGAKVQWLISLFH